MLMATRWVETNNVVQRKHGMQGEGSMKVRETPVQRIVPTARGLRLNPEYLKRLKAEHREALEALAENDGPVLRAKGETQR